MKHQLTVATVLGALVFIGVSYLAQATEKKAPITPVPPAAVMDASAAQFKPLAAPPLWPRY